MNRAKIISDYIEAFIAFNRKLPVMEAREKTVVIAMGYAGSDETYTFSYEDLIQLTRNLQESINFARSIEKSDRRLSDLCSCLATVNISEVTEHAIVIKRSSISAW